MKKKNTRKKKAGPIPSFQLRSGLFAGLRRSPEEFEPEAGGVRKAIQMEKAWAGRFGAALKNMLGVALRALIPKEVFLWAAGVLAVLIVVGCIPLAVACATEEPSLWQEAGLEEIWNERTFGKSGE